MNEARQPGIFLMVSFDWPLPMDRAHGQYAKELHDLAQGKTWIREILAANGGIGGDQSAVWVFWLENYASLDKLLKDRDEEVALAYQRFFSAMNHVRDQIREEVVFK